MRGRGNFLAGAALIALVFLLSTAPRLWRGSARLVSIEEIADVGDACYRPSHTDLNQSAPPEQSLFSAFAQDSGDTVDVTRPPGAPYRGYRSYL